MYNSNQDRFAAESDARFEQMRRDMDARARAQAQERKRREEEERRQREQQQQQQQQQRPQSFTPPPSANVPSGVDRAKAEEQTRVDADNRARETARLADIEKNRYQRVSGKEGEQRRKELESKSSAAASRATGAMGQKLPRPSTNIVSPQKSILGLPKESRQFTKFGESINRAANLTYSNPEARVGGM